MEQLSFFSAQAGAPGVTYIYAGARSGQIKIGLSANPERRARQLKLALLHVELGGKARERELHRRFRSARIEGEWFMPTDAVLAWIVGNNQPAA